MTIADTTAAVDPYYFGSFAWGAGKSVAESGPEGPNASDIDRWQANLMVCVYAKDAAGIKAALGDRYASRLIDSLRDSRYFPIHAAVMADDKAVLRALVDALSAAVLDAKDDSGRTPLMCAAERGQAALIHILLAGGASVDLTDRFGHSALMWAALSGHVDAVKVLLGYEGYTSDDTRASINKQDSHGETALILAIRAGHYDVVQALIQRGCDVNVPNERGERALSLAISLGRHQIVRMLCDQPALDIDAADHKGVTPIMYAVDYTARAYDCSLLNLLVRRGARTDLTDHDGCTALLRAAKGHSDIAIEHLLLGGARIDAVDPAGCCALALAAKFGNLSALTYLLKNTPIRVNTQDQGGRTPLFHAVMSGHREAAYELIKHGAHINYWHEASASTVLTVAKRRGDQAMVSLLRMHGASDQIELNPTASCTV